MLEKKRYGIIYLIRNEINGKIYIGQTVKTFDKRYSGGLEKSTHNDHLRSSIRKYGIENFYIDKEFDVAYSKEELDKLEDMYIKIYNTTNPDYGYNKQTGGSNGIPTDESKKKMSENADKRRVVCLTTREIFDSEKEACEYYNLNTSLVSCLKGKRNRRFSGRLECGSPLVWVYYEDYLSMSEEEIKNKIEHAKESKVINRVSKKVICLNTKEIFENTGQAQSKYKIYHITSCCLGKRNYSGLDENGNPLVWMYYEDYLKEGDKKLYEILNNPQIIKRRKIICLNNLEIYDSFREIVKKYKHTYDCIKKSCEKHEPIYDGYSFMYYDEYLKLPLEQQHKKPLEKRKVKGLGSRGKKIICLNDNCVYNTIADASRKYNLDHSSLVKVCKHKLKQIKGYIFMYYDEYLREENDNAEEK